jgi:hypothetical protein
VVFVNRACHGSDPYATYNNLTLAQLYALTPNIAQEAWDAYFTNAGLQIDGTETPLHWWVLLYAFLEFNSFLFFVWAQPPT